MFHPSSEFSLPPGSASIIASTGVMSLVANPGEELGWRGFALPKLQLRYGRINSSLIVGILSGLWHVPIFVLPSEAMAHYPYPYWFAGIIFISFIYTWLYNQSKGNVLVTTVFHVSLNVASVVIGINSFATYAVVTLSLVIVLMILKKI